MAATYTAQDRVMARKYVAERRPELIGRHGSVTRIQGKDIIVEWDGLAGTYSHSASHLKIDRDGHRGSAVRPGTLTRVPTSTPGVSMNPPADEYQGRGEAAREFIVLLMRGGKHSVEVHGVGCRDISRAKTQGLVNNQWSVTTAMGRQGVVEDYAADFLGEHEKGEWGSVWTDYAPEVHFHPCTSL